MLISEKKSFYRFLSLYLLLILTLITSVSIIYYKSHSQRIMLEYKSIAQDYAILQSRRLKWLHNHFPKYNKYPRDSRYKSAIYDLEFKEIFSTLECKNIDFTKNLYSCGDSIVYIQTLSDYYLGAKYLLIEIPKSSLAIKNLIYKIVVLALSAFVLFLIAGYYLAKLFIKPMSESIDILDKFIKDTTHEINTPISIINTNIEMLQKYISEDKAKKLVKRVKIASRTLENIYKDLRYLTLCSVENYSSTKIDLKALVKERVEYFALHMEAKKINCNLDLEEFTIEADKKLISRMIDNIISNAIKYNKIGGKINIILRNSELIVEDSGIGIAKENLKEIFDRYKRFNSVEGGFGIGLNIVQNIVKMYNLKIEIKSQKDIGTKVIIKW